MSKIVIAEKTNRNIGIELLRIVSMYMVLILHIFNKTDLIFGAELLSAKYQIAWLLEIIAYCAVNCYVLISGYVGIEAKYKYTNIIVLWIRVMFYSVGITAITSVFFSALVNKSLWITSCLPTISNTYWFFTSYVGLFMLMPVINKAVNSMNKKQAKCVIIVLVTLFSVLQTIINNDIFGINYGYSTLWFIIVYFIGASIKKFNLLSKIKTKTFISIYCALIFSTWLSNFVIENLTLHVLNEVKGKGMLVSYTSPTILLIAIMMLLIFSNINIMKRYQSVILTFSSVTFSVYILHTHKIIEDNVLTKMANLIESMNALEMIVFVIIGIAIMYIICSLICMADTLIIKKLRIKERIYSIEQKYIGNIWD